MEEAKLVAVSSYRLVRGDGSETETPTNSANHSDDHGDELTGMYTEDMLDEKNVLGRAVMTEDQARRLRERGAGGSDAASGAELQET
jgi:hypothetical protein